MSDGWSQSLAYMCNPNIENVLIPLHMFLFINYMSWLILTHALHLLPVNTFNAWKKKRSFTVSAVWGFLIHYYVILFCVLFYQVFVCQK